jgi:hypothetical protein
VEGLLLGQEARIRILPDERELELLERDLASQGSFVKLPRWS